MDYKEVLRRFTYEDETDISVRIESADNSNYRENRDIINEIILWKMNRTPEVSDVIRRIAQRFLFQKLINCYIKSTRKKAIKLYINCNIIKMNMRTADYMHK